VMFLLSGLMLSFCAYSQAFLMELRQEVRNYTLLLSAARNNTSSFIRLILRRAISLGHLQPCMIECWWELLAKLTVPRNPLCIIHSWWALSETTILEDKMQVSPDYSDPYLVIFDVQVSYIFSVKRTPGFGRRRMHYMLQTAQRETNSAMLCPTTVTQLLLLQILTICLRPAIAKVISATIAKFSITAFCRCCLCVSARKQHMDNVS
jgi:hypothetical protein